MPPARHGRPPATPVPDPTWGDRIRALRYVPKLIKLVWNTHPAYTSVMTVLRVARAFVPVAALWVGKLIIDRVVALRDDARLAPRRSGASWPLEIAIVFGGELLARASSLVESLLGDLFSNHMSIRLMEHAATLDLAQFEDPEFYDHLERARRQTVGRIGLLSRAARDGAGLAHAAHARRRARRAQPVALAAARVAVLPSFLGETHFAALEYSLLFRCTPERRQLDYLRYVGASDVTAKEVQMFGLAGWLVDRYRVLAQQVLRGEQAALDPEGDREQRALDPRHARLLRRVRDHPRAPIGGQISIGTLTFLAASFGAEPRHHSAAALDASDIYEQSLYLRDLFDFFEMRPTITDRERQPARADADPRRLRVRGRRLPVSGERALGGAARELRAAAGRADRARRRERRGEDDDHEAARAALRCRPKGASCSTASTSASTISAQLRRAIGVIFQDFVRYDMRFDENIGVGEIERVRDYLDHVDGDGDEPAVPDGARRMRPSSRSRRRCCRASQDGYHQMLGRRFEDGVDLSGGEWQKIALARAYLREAQLLILDEPTAALDARAEYEVFMRFSELVAGRMAVLISHRFSTVRMADRIIVLQNGGSRRGGHARRARGEAAGCTPSCSRCRRRGTGSGSTLLATAWMGGLNE